MRRALIVIATLLVLSPMSSAADNPAKAFTIADAGTATGLVPGGTVTRKVRVTNPNNQDIKVTGLTTSVGRPSTSCPANAVTVDPLSIPFVIAKNASADVSLTVRMAASAPNACRNLTFPLTYSGTAIKP
ncbi:hypothetical protein UK23_45480 [Lentzea aerocolonigenes]|uniref:Uncharacterized protein n=1 Tax=Lentzea aerocolonigenes TaxID=68170 RepID=A0A0F0GHC8_LENAE|nr:hypothetical protein [Lentzea aerocolonigenes]KJK33592.1 hypothetical protein UK23_45480 [Lentzea aerocolonigenes]